MKVMLGAKRPASTAAPHLKFLSVGRSHVGAVRQLNEDAYCVRPGAGLWAVADGMGGHARGDVASTRVIEALDGVGRAASAYGFRDAVSRAVARANDELFQAGGEGISGSTLVTLLAHEGHYACLWAGDSRSYLYRGGVLKRLTSDHSEVQELVDAGVLASEDAPRHPRANVITRAIGARSRVKLDDVCGVLQVGDRFLLCSDGLHGAVNDHLIGDMMRRAPLEWAAKSLIDLALAYGGRDNVTVVLVGVEAA